MKKLFIKIWKLITRKKFTAQLVMFDVVNGNGRIYSKDCFDINDLNDKARKGTMIGHLGYPMSGLSLDASVASHNFTKFNFDDNTNSLCGKAYIMDTESGKILKKILDQCVIRPRGIGEAVDGKIMNYELISFDAIPKQEDSFQIKKS